MNIKEAEDLVRKHLSDQIGIQYHPDPPVSIYNFNPEENYLFSFGLSSPDMVGGSDYISMSKTTGEVKILGTIGE